MVQLPEASDAFLLDPAHVRRNDTSARSINEWTGERMLQDSDIADDVRPQTVQSLGNYAVQVRPSTSTADVSAIKAQSFSFCFQLCWTNNITSPQIEQKSAVLHLVIRVSIERNTLVGILSRNVTQ